MDDTNAIATIKATLARVGLAATDLASTSATIASRDASASESPWRSETPIEFSAERGQGGDADGYE